MVTDANDRKAAAAAQFSAAVKGIPTYVVAQALGSLIGNNWTGCSKGAMAIYYGDAVERGYAAVFPAVGRVKLDELAKRARAKQSGDPKWRMVR